MEIKGKEIQCTDITQLQYLVIKYNKLASTHTRSPQTTQQQEGCHQEEGLTEK